MRRGSGPLDPMGKLCEKRAMRRRAAQPKPEIIGEILRKVLKKRNIPHTSTDRRLLDLWARAVGPQIAARTRPEAVKRGTLHVRVSSPVWMHQLQFLKEEICGKINELSGNDGDPRPLSIDRRNPLPPSGRLIGRLPLPLPRRSASATGR